MLMSMIKHVIKHLNIFFVSLINSHLSYFETVNVYLHMGMDDRKNSCMNCTKRNNSLLSDLSNGELKLLDKNKYSVSYKSGEIICKEGSKPLGLICLKNNYLISFR